MCDQKPFCLKYLSVFFIAELNSTEIIDVWKFAHFGHTLKTVHETLKKISLILIIFINFFSL